MRIEHVSSFARPKDCPPRNARSEIFHRFAARLFLFKRCQDVSCAGRVAYWHPKIFKKLSKFDADKHAHAGAQGLSSPMPRISPHADKTWCCSIEGLATSLRKPQTPSLESAAMQTAMRTEFLGASLKSSTAMKAAPAAKPVAVQAFFKKAAKQADAPAKKATQASPDPRHASFGADHTVTSSVLSRIVHANL